MKEYLSIIITVLSVVAGFITWVLNERSKRKQESFKRKEERYAELIRSIKGFYVDSSDTTLITNFLDQVNLCWLYCPDNIIKKLDEFLEAVKTDSFTSENKEKILGELMIAIRQDLLKDTKLKTNLTYQDFRIFSANKSK
ncbi:hypothetical protein [Fictibacillus gelatini]|uniref:hypothetical protein n=1 Tax=Fictibacillus gelatini TaxID=225985 RepID=UPI00047AC4C3|nr:hypothetical protein [Fictibacillus gelatini]